jgi:large repetitive protein
VIARRVLLLAVLLTATCACAWGEMTIFPTTLPNGFVGTPYPATRLGVSGTGIIPTWAVTVGTLPAGLALDSSTGIISGTPTAAGSSTFTVTATVGTASLVQVFTVGINALTITGLPSIAPPGTQPSATVSLIGGASTDTFTVTLTLSFVPASGSAQPYDAKFANGSGTTTTFPIPTPQGNTTISVPVIVGTVAGTITITTTSFVNSHGIALPVPAPIVITVNPTAPVITGGVIPCAVTLSGFNISITGFSSTRDMTSALFHFTLPTNTQPSTLDVTVPLTTAFAAWYGSPNSNAFGSTFKMTVQFSFTGPPGSTVPFIAVTTTLTNSKGTSTPPIAGQPSAATCP